MALKAATNLVRTYPVTRGMITYSVLWPVANVTQQLIIDSGDIDFKRALRFGLWGSCFVAPTLYVWVRVSTRMFPGTSVVTAIKKACVEQVMYSPFTISSFLIGLNLLEGKSLEMAMHELKEKFIPTWKTGACFWPFIQTVNFAFIKEKNRVSFVGVFSFLWTIFLSYVQQRKIEDAAGRT